jgi:hypothetical protein
VGRVWQKKWPAGFASAGHWFGQAFARTALVLQTVHRFGVGLCPSVVKNGLSVRADYVGVSFGASR